ncbi:MAG: mevalonate kinase [Polyangiaceae bacterium]|jgi:mevalonate kinase|nr:mevalonate kinase [Polyangiaceae bacterium]
MNGTACSTLGDGCGHGKVILLGEHAVVHGITAIAVGIGRSVEASVYASTTAPTQLQVHDAHGQWIIERDAELWRAFRALCDDIGVDRPVRAVARITVPTRAGLGSSAAMGVALAQALFASRGLPRDAERVERAAQAWEKVFHGNPSGIDVAAAIHGGCIAFARGKGATQLPLARPLCLCIGDTGERSSTREMVERVTAVLHSSPGLGQRILGRIRDAVEAARLALEHGDHAALGRAMQDNGMLLAQLGLATPTSDTLVASARAAGACGAKVTGAGGGGCVVALAPGVQDRVLNAWARDGFRGFAVDVHPA